MLMDAFAFEQVWFVQLGIVFFFLLKTGICKYFSASLIFLRCVWWLFIVYINQSINLLNPKVFLLNCDYFACDVILVSEK